MRLVWRLAVVCMVVLWAEAALAQRRPIADDTLGEEQSIVTPLDPDLPVDRIDGGAERGDNLFHSFQEFHVDEGRGVYFDDRGFANIISRVTGGVASDILGVLGVIGDANLFLINPSGIIFGPNASLDVRGAFVGTTADSFVFGDGFAFSATNPQAPPLLTVSTPIGLQYGVQLPGAITMDQALLVIDSGQSLILAGGAITLNNSGIGVRDPQGGRIELGAVSGSGIVGLQQNGSILSLIFPETLARADVQITNRSGINVIAEDGGSVAINAQNLDVLGESLIRAGIEQGRRAATNQAGDIVLDATGEIQVGQSSQISNNVFSNAIGNAGNLQINAGSLSVTNGSALSASTFGQGNAGSIIINADDRVVFDNGNVFSNVEGIGNGGDVRITTGSLSLTGGAQLATSTLGQGNAGDVTVNARNQVVFNDAAVLSTVGAINSDVVAVGNGGDIRITTGSLSLTGGAQLATSTLGQGNAGDVTVNARNQVVFNDAAVFSTVGAINSDVVAVGNGGDIRITTGSLSLTGGAQLVAGTLGQGNAGDIIINANDRVLFAGSGVISSAGATNSDAAAVGNAGNVIINANDRVVFDDSTAISSVEEGSIGRGGNINIDTNSLVVRGALLSTSTLGQGNAGSVIINANDRVLFDDANVFSTVEPVNLEGIAIREGGDVRITTGSLEVINGAQLQASTLGRGNAGDVIIVSDRVLFDGTSVAFSSVEEGGRGSGGNINIHANSLIVRNGAQLAAITRGQGRAGNIRVNADTVSLDGIGSDGTSSGLFTLTSGRGQGGEITIRTDSIRLTNGAVVNAETDNAFRGGNVTLNTETFEATGGGQVVTTTAGSGQAGNITLNVTDRITLSGFDPDYADRLEQFGEAVISNQGAASGLFANTAENSSGQGGTIRITTGELDISDRARIVVNSQGNGVAGDIDITAQSIELDRGRLTAETNTVEGGSIAIATDSLSLTDGARISVDGTDSAGEAGDIEVQARNIELDEASQITAETASGQGGDITLRDVDLLLLRNGSNISTTAGTRQAGGDGGNITIDADFIVAFPNENSDISANAFSGSGGRIDITTEGLFGIEERDPPTEFSDITASSELGVQGEININTPDVDPSRGITELPEDVVDASDQIAQTCPTDGDVAGELGEFVVTGRGGVPANPAELLGGETVLSELAEVEGEEGEGDEGDGEVERDDRPATVETNPADIVEAQGWVVGADGKVILTAGNPAVEPYSPATVPVHCARR